MKCLVIILIVFFVFSCSSVDTTPGDVAHDPSPQSSHDNVLNEALLSAMKARAQMEYVLGPEDLLDIDVFQVDELKKTVRVNSKGYIKLPLVGQVKASGLTVSELEGILEKKLESFIQDPEISVFIKEFRSQRITLLGAVRKQQVYTVTGQHYLLDIISRADGLAEDAGEICYVQREKETIIIDMRGLLHEGNTQLNIPVFGGDVVFIPRGGTIFVSGAVEGPGSFPVKGKVTLTQAVAMARDLKDYAAKGEIRIYRDIGKGERQIIEVDYDEILEGRYSDVMLQDKDIIIVPTSGPKRVFWGMVKSLRWVVNLGNVDLGVGFIQ